jgi:hypothetical protein
VTAISLKCWSESDQKAIREQLVRILNSGPFHQAGSGSWSTSSMKLLPGAASGLARLATSPTVEKENTEARFWELYWGELALVESEEVQGLMVQFCQGYFDPARCTTSDEGVHSSLAKPPPRLH